MDEELLEQLERVANILNQREIDDENKPILDISEHNVVGRDLLLHTAFTKHDEQEATYVLEHALKEGSTIVAWASSILINKEALAGKWQAEMRLISPRAQKFASTLFDDAGKLRETLINHVENRGTGVWAEELDEGYLLYLNHLAVEKQHRSKGYGKWLLNHILHHEHASRCDYAYTWPAPGRSLLDLDGLSEEQFAVTQTRVLRLFTNAGFRRVGRTCFFCYARDDNHRSKRLAAENDATLSKYPLARDDIRSLSHLIATEDDPCILADSIDAQLTKHPDSIREVDEAGMTPLHVAASLYKHVAVNKLTRSANVSDLWAENLNGQTPLDCLDASIASGRAMCASAGEPWLGASEWAGICKGLLLYHMDRPLFQTDNPAFWDPNRYGCTCGQCMEGHLSPTMQLSISNACGYVKDIYYSEVMYWKRGRKNALKGGPLEKHFPSAVRHAAKKPFLSGILAVLDMITFCMDNEVEPTTETVGQRLLLGNEGAGTVEQQAYASFAVQGGRPSNVLGGLLYFAYELGPLEEDDIAHLPRCANDLDWTLVRHKLGVSDEDFYGYPDENAASTAQRSSTSSSAAKGSKSAPKKRKSTVRSSADAHSVALPSKAGGSKRTKRK